jgi:Helix-turn-helix domain
MKSTASAEESSQDRDCSANRGARTRTWGQDDLQRMACIRTALENVNPAIDPMPFVPNWMRSLMPHLKGAPFAVLCAYISHANNTTGIAWPAIRTLSAETGCGHCTVDRARAFLVACGLLVRLGQDHRGGRWGRTKFKLVWKSAEKPPITEP